MRHLPRLHPQTQLPLQRRLTNKSEALESIVAGTGPATGDLGGPTVVEAAAMSTDTGGDIASGAATPPAHQLLRQPLRAPLIPRQLNLCLRCLSCSVCSAWPVTPALPLLAQLIERAALRLRLHCRCPSRLPRRPSSNFLPRSPRQLHLSWTRLLARPVTAPSLQPPRHSHQCLLSSPSICLWPGRSMWRAMALVPRRNLHLLLSPPLPCPAGGGTRQTGPAVAARGSPAPR